MAQGLKLDGQLSAAGLLAAVGKTTRDALLTWKDFRRAFAWDLGRAPPAGVPADMDALQLARCHRKRCAARVREAVKASREAEAQRECTPPPPSLPY